MKNKLFYSLVSGVLLSTALVSSSFATIPYNDPEYEANETFSNRISIAIRRIEEITNKVNSETNEGTIRQLNGALSLWRERLEQNQKLSQRENGETWTVQPSTIATNLGQIPDGVLYHVFTYLGPKSLSKVAVVNKKFNFISNDERLWKNFSQELSFMTCKNISNNKSYVTSVIRHSTIALIEAEKQQEIDALINLGSNTAIRQKISGLMTGDYGYPENWNLLNSFLEEFSKKGNSVALASKIKGVSMGMFGYAVDEESLPKLVEEIVKTGSPESFEIMANCLYRGMYGFVRNHLATREFIEEWVKKENSEAIRYKIIGLTQEGGAWGFQQDEKAAHGFIEELAQKGNPVAISKKIDGLYYGSYGYDRDEEAASSFLKSLVLSMHPAGIKIQISYLTTGDFNKPIDSKAAHEFIEELAQKGNPVAIQYQTVGQLSGKYGYSKIPDGILKYGCSLSLLLSQ